MCIFKVTDLWLLTNTHACVHVYNVLKSLYAYILIPFFLQFKRQTYCHLFLIVKSQIIYNAAIQYKWDTASIMQKYLFHPTVLKILH